MLAAAAFHAVSSGADSSTIVSVFGALAALAGLEHGIGAALQGSTAPPGLVFASWPEAAFFRAVAGEPAMTLVPNLLASGLLAILVSLGLLLWSVTFPHRRGTGPVLLGLSVLLLLVGGGFGPPLLGTIVAATAAAGTRALACSPRPPGGLGRALAALWPWVFAAAVGAWLLLMPGTMLLDTVLGLEDVETVVPVFILVAFATLGLSIFAALARDRKKGSVFRHP